MMIDRVVLVFLCLTAVLTTLSLSDGWVTACLLGLVVSGGAYAWIRLDRTRPIHDVQPLLGRLARRIGRLTGARVIAFGHTHKPTIERRGATQWINPGSWEHLPWSDKHACDSECFCGVRYGVVTGVGADTQIYLVDWCSHARLPHSARQSEGREAKFSLQALRQGVGSFSTHLNHILGSLRDRRGHVAALRHNTQVVKPEM